MERRVLVAIFLSFLVLYGYQALFVKPVPKRPVATSATGAPATTAPGQPTVAVSPAPPKATSVAPPAEAPPATTLVGGGIERDVRVETGDVIAVFTNRGARLKSWRLKHFKDQHNEPLELVAHDLAATQA